MSRHAGLADAFALAGRLRPADAAEIRVSTGRPPHWAVPRAFSLSAKCRVLCPNRYIDHPYAIYGVATDAQNPYLGVIWLLATPEIRHYSKATLKKSKALLTEMAEGYPGGLHNYVWTENTLHVRWCVLAGFRLGSTVQRNGTTFIHVHWTP